VIALAVASALLTPPSSAQVTGGSAPASFDVDASAVPVLIGASAPSALPLDVAAGVGFSGVKLNSQPKGTADAGPGYVPLAGALPLLGGPGALPGIGARLLPGLLVGFPTIVGLPPLPIDPTVVSPPNIPVLPAPPLPPVECIASVPGDTDPVSCGGPTQDILGFNVGAASGTATAQGDPTDPSTLRVDAAVRGAGFAASSTNALLPVSVGSIASSASSYVKDGRVVAGVSTAVQDLSILGALRIPSLQTSVSAALDGTPGNAALQGERCTIAGATVAGVPVTIDGDGVHVAGQNQTLGSVLSPLNALVDSTLQQLGVTLKTLAGTADPGSGQAAAFPGTATISDDGTKVTASLACLQVSYKVPTSGSVVTVTFGSATVAMQAFTALPLSKPGSTSASVSTATPGGLTSPVASGSGRSNTTPTPPPSAPAAGVGAPAPATQPFEQIGVGWQMPYAPFAVLAMCLPLAIWSRRIGPLRLPSRAQVAP
jgi:hypothetical protein